MNEDLVTVESFGSVARAEIARMYLEAQGIDAYLNNEEAAMSDWYPGNALGGVKVQVSSADASRAVAALLAKKESLDAEGDRGDDDAGACLACGTPMGEEQTTCKACGWTFGGDAITEG